MHRLCTIGRRLCLRQKNERLPINVLKYSQFLKPSNIYFINTYSRGRAILGYPVPLLLSFDRSLRLAANAKEGPASLEALTFRSIKGREIKTFIFGDTLEPSVLVIGGIHGDEPEGVQLAQAFLDYLSVPICPMKSHGIVVLPVANPDGFYTGTRVNARGIDINRNFPTRDFQQGLFKKSCYPGREPASEPETIAILQLASQFKPRLIFSFHAEMGCVNFDGPAVEIAKAISIINGLPVRQDLGYRTPGSLGTYFGVERNIPVITLELLRGDNQWERHGMAILEAIGHLEMPMTAKSKKSIQ